MSEPTLGQSHSDVLILGGGLAGMAAADSLRKTGLDITVLEASDRLGGRTRSDYWAAAGRHLDMGGTWLLPDFSQTLALLDDLELATTESPDPELFLTHFRTGVQQRQEPSRDERDALETASARLARIVGESDGVMTAQAALQAIDDGTEEFDFIEDWYTALQRYLAGAPMQEVSAEHLLVPWEDLLDPEHYRIQIRGTTRSLVDSLHARTSATVHLGTEVVAVHRTGGDLSVRTADGRTFGASHVIVALPLNCLSGIGFDDDLIDGYGDFIAHGHVGASRKDWLILDGVDAHFRVFGSQGPYGYLRSEERLPDGGLLCVGFAPSAESGPTVSELEADLRVHSLPNATVRDTWSHNWVEDVRARGAWFAPRPGQYAQLRVLPEDRQEVQFIGGDLHPEFPGTIEGAVASGRRAAAAILHEGE